MLELNVKIVWHPSLDSKPVLLLEVQNRKRFHTQVVCLSTWFDFQNGLVLELNVTTVWHPSLDSKPVLLLEVQSPKRFDTKLFAFQSDLSDIFLSFSDREMPQKPPKTPSSDRKPPDRPRLRTCPRLPPGGGPSPSLACPLKWDGLMSWIHLGEWAGCGLTSSRHGWVFCMPGDLGSAARPESI